MAIVDLKRLVGRLNGRSRRTLETAAALTLSRRTTTSRLGTGWCTLAADIDLDVTAVLQHYGVDRERLAADLSRTLGNWSTGNAGAPALAPEIVELIKQAWMVASIEQEATRIRSGHLLWGLIADERLAQRAREVSEQLLKIDQDALKRDFATITASSLRVRKHPSGSPRARLSLPPLPFPRDWDMIELLLSRGSAARRRCPALRPVLTAEAPEAEISSAALASAA